VTDGAALRLFDAVPFGNRENLRIDGSLTSRYLDVRGIKVWSLSLDESASGMRQASAQARSAIIDDEGERHDRGAAPGRCAQAINSAVSRLIEAPWTSLDQSRAAIRSVIILSAMMACLDCSLCSLD